MAKRELIEPSEGDHRYVRRDGDGRFKEVEDVGRSSAHDQKREAKNSSRRRQDAKGDRSVASTATNGLRRVVVVNDAHAVLALYGELLEELSYEVVLMVTEAVETDRITAARPDAVVLDLEVGLQADYGIRMAQELRRDTRYGAIPIVIATAHVEALDGARETLRQIGVPVLLKPFSSEALRESLEPG